MGPLSRSGRTYRLIVFSHGGDLWTASAAGGSAVALPMPLAGSGACAPDGKRIVYSKDFRDSRPEKRYGGGQADYLAIFDFASNAARTISKGPRAERDAMWIGDRIYYNPDRDGTFNLCSYDTRSGTTAQLTHSKTWDVRWPSADPTTGRSIYEYAGELTILDTWTGEEMPIHVAVTDDGVTSRPSRVAAAGQVEAFDLSPKGERAVFAARGDIFTVPVERGYTRNRPESRRPAATCASTSTGSSTAWRACRSRRTTSAASRPRRAPCSTWSPGRRTTRARASADRSS